MHSILVVNPKGGSGKTTVATNLAGALAGLQDEVLLWDLDRQQSALTWLAMRPSHLPRIVRLDRREDDPSRINPKRNWLVIDSPAAWRAAKSARCSIWATVVRRRRPRIPGMPSGVSHSLL